MHQIVHEEWVLSLKFSLIILHNQWESPYGFTYFYLQALKF